jgi:hypothetical protein
VYFQIFSKLFFISKFILQSVVIHLAKLCVRLQWLAKRHSVEPKNKIYILFVHTQSLLGYRTVRTCIECRCEDSVFIAKAIRYLDTEQCQQYQNLYISNAGNTPPSTAMDLQSQPGPRTPWTKVTNKRNRTTQEDSIWNAKHIKEDSHWLHPTTTHNRYAEVAYKNK